MTEIHSRYDDPTLVSCDDCGWQGPVKDCKHGYRGMPVRGEDVEPCDYCPQCGSAHLFPIEEELVPA